MSWMKDYLPEQEQFDKISLRLYQFRNRIALPEIPDFKVHVVVYKFMLLSVFF